MKKRILKIFAIILAVALCLGLIGFYVYNNFYRIDRSQFHYIYLSRIVDSPNGKYAITLDILRTTEKSETTYIEGNLIAKSQQIDIPSAKVKTIFWQKVNSSDIKNKWIDDVWLDNWVDVNWIDNETVKINNITLNIFNDVYDYRRN